MDYPPSPPSSLKLRGSRRLRKDKYSIDKRNTLYYIKHMKKLKKIPVFKNLKEEAVFWDNHDINDYLSKVKETKILYSARIPKEETIVVRLQKNLKNRLEQIAKNSNVTLSTLLRMWCIEKVKLHS